MTQVTLETFKDTRVPSNWVISSSEGEVITATNVVTKDIFTGTVDEFNAFLMVEIAEPAPLLYDLTTGLPIAAAGSASPIVVLAGTNELTNELSSLKFTGTGLSATLGDAGQVIVNVDTPDIPVQTAIIDVTNNYTITINVPKRLRVNSAAPIAVTIPAHATVAIPIGTEMDVSQVGAGQVTIEAAAGVFIKTPETRKLRRKLSVAKLFKTEENIWELSGDLEAAPVSLVLASFDNDPPTEAYGKVITLDGVATMSTAESRFGTRSVRGKGMDGYAIIQDVVLGNNPWTIECSLMQMAPATNGYSLALFGLGIPTRPSGPNKDQFVIYQEGGAIYWGYQHHSGWFAEPLYEEWYGIVIMFNGTHIRVKREGYTASYYERQLVGVGADPDYSQPQPITVGGGYKSSSNAANANVHACNLRITTGVPLWDLPVPPVSEFSH